MTYAVQGWHQSTDTNLSIGDIGRLRAMDDAIAGRAGPIYDVTTYGAAQNGTTDDTAAINATVDAAAVGGGTVRITGPAAISTPVRLKSGVALEATGHWWGTSYLKLKSGFTGAAGVIVDSNTVVGASVRNLRVDCSALTTGTVKGIYLDHTGNPGDKHHRIYNVQVYQPPGVGIHFGTGCGFCWITDCYVNKFGTTTAEHGVHIAYADSFLSGVIVGLAGANGFYIGGANNHLVGCEAFNCGTVSTSNTGYGFEVRGNNNTLAGVVTQDGATHGLVIKDCNQAVVSGYNSSSNAGSAVVLDNTDDCSITGGVTGTNQQHTNVVTMLNTPNRNRVRMTYGSTSVSGAPLSGTITGNDIRLGGQPEDRNRARLEACGVIAESFPLETASTNGVPTLQRLVCTALWFYAGEVITGIALPVIIGAAGTTYARVAVYSGNTLVANSNDLTGTLNGAGGGKYKCDLSSPYTIPSDGMYRCGFLFDGGTAPSIARVVPGGPQVYTALSGFANRIVAQAGQASLPSPASFGGGASGDSFAFEVY